MPWGFESPLSHQKIRVPLQAFGFFNARGDSKGGSENSPVDCFPAVGESFRFQTHPVGMWMESEYVRCRKTLVRRTFSRNPTRTLAPNVSKSHPGFGDIFVCARVGTRTFQSNLPVAGWAIPAGRNCFLTICLRQIGNESPLSHPPMP